MNPDLTDINLEPNSSLLLQVVLPTPKQTLLIQNAVLQQAEQNVVQNASQLAQADQAKGNLVDIPQNLPYTTLDFTPEVLIEGTEEPTGEGGGGGVVETVEEVMRQQVRGLKDDPTLKMKTIPPKKDDLSQCGSYTELCGSYTELCGIYTE